MNGTVYEVTYMIMMWYSMHAGQVIIIISNFILFHLQATWQPPQNPQNKKWPLRISTTKYISLYTGLSIYAVRVNCIMTTLRACLPDSCKFLGQKVQFGQPNLCMCCFDPMDANEKRQCTIMWSTTTVCLRVNRNKTII